MTFRVALRQERAAVVGSGECAAVAAREEAPPEEEEERTLFWKLRFAKIANSGWMPEDGCGTGTHRPGVSKPR